VLTSAACEAPAPRKPPAEAARDRPLNVIVNLRTWLPITQNWVFTQAACLPANVVPHVTCVDARNLDRFAMPRFHAFSQLSRAARLAALLESAPILRGSLSRNTALIARVAKRSRAELVHSHFGFTGYHSARAIKRLGLKHVVTFYGVDMSAMPASDPRWLDRYRMLFELADRVLCEGPHMAERVADLGCPRDRLRVHRLGVRLDALPFRPRTWRRGEPLRVLIAASFREKKGIPYGLEALARLRARTPMEITIIGDASDHPSSQAEKLRILATVAKCSLASSVRFMGYQSWQLLMDEAYRHHVFLAPSVTASDGDSEGGAPVVLIEMAATGIPIVSSMHADIPAIVEHGVGGWLAAERDVDALTACLQRLIDAPEQWPVLVQAARQRVEREFNAETQGRALAEVYESVRET